MMRTAWIFLLFFLSDICLAQSQIDSLEQAFAAEANDSLKWELTDQLYKAYAFVQSDSALVWTQRGHEIAQKLADKYLLGQSHYRMGLALLNKHDYATSMTHFLQAIKLFETTGNEKWMIETEFEIGLIYRQNGDYAEAKKYLDRFYQYYLDQEDGRSVIFALANYNILYEKMGLPDSMIYYGREALKAVERYNLPENLAKLHNNLAGCYLYKKDYENAKIHYDKAREIGFENDKVAHFFSVYGLADMYYSLNLLDSSIHYANQALEYARVYQDLAKEAELNHFLAKNYAQKKDFERANDFLLDYMQLKDSLQASNNEVVLSELQVQFETQKKESQIAQQQLLLQQETSKRSLVIVLFSLGLLLLSGFIFFLRSRQRNQQRRTALELQLKNAEAEKLRELDQVKSGFFANISHEFRTPLTLLLGPLREMEKGTFKGDESKYRKMMIRNGERLLRLVNQLLDLSKLESGHIQVTNEPGNLTQLVRSVVFSFESWAMRKQIYYQTQFPEKPVYAYFDRDKLEKILTNLISNALKFTPEEERVGFEMKVMPSSDDNMKLLIEISDTGIGIPEAQLHHIFDRFYSAGQEQEELGGIGIGLALTKELVELQGGTITVESKENQGTTFRVELPIKLAKAREEEFEAMAATSPAASPELAQNGAIKVQNQLNLQHPIVLIAEDNSDLRVYLKDQLQGSYQVVEAVNGREALEKAVDLIPDLVITDLMMPKMDGIDFAHHIKTDEKTSHIPIIMLTARADQEDKLKGLKTGADAYLTKPFDAEELSLRVEKLIEQRRQLRERFSKGNKPVLDIEVAQISPLEEAFLTRLVAIIEENMDNEDFSIEEMSKSIGMSRSQLHRKLKALTDQSPSVFLRTLRLQRAHKLLQQKAGNISEIAFEVGIPNLAYFSRSFSRQFGYPPSKLLYA
ncbi:MAG: hypothetical protein DHS20C18_06030 [Saprospiraceae bacterium]|nr:MAG: hypothetical protein DHS20C18_06030 [Saprospiraceae bacterium]